MEDRASCRCEMEVDGEQQNVSLVEGEDAVGSCSSTTFWSCSHVTTGGGEQGYGARQSKRFSFVESVQCEDTENRGSKQFGGAGDGAGATAELLLLS